MNTFKYYTIGRGVTLLYHFLGSIGITGSTRNTILSIYGTVMGTYFGDILIYPLGLVIYIYDMLGNINVDLPQWVTDLYHLVMNTIAPAWNWVMSNLHALINFANSIASTIILVGTALFNALLSAWLSALNFARTLYVNFGAFLIAFLHDPVGYVTSVINTVLHSLLTGFNSIWQVWVSLIHPYLAVLSQILTDPIGFILSVLHVLFPALFAIYDDLIKFIQWWRAAGSNYLVNFVNNPVGFILDLIAGTFLEWLANLIADNI